MTEPALRVGVIGDPVAHSLSPALQQPAFDALRIPARYELWPTPAAELPARVATLRAPDALGANVTVPHKLAVMALVDEVLPVARRAGAVNTVVNRDGRLYGDNTDVAGFAAALRAERPDPRGLTALILGAGGAARAVALALDDLGFARVTVANRNPARAHELSAALGIPSLRVATTDLPSLAAALSDTRVLVNATSLGWHPGEAPLPLELLAALPADALVVDVTYRATDLLDAARQRGLATLDGLPMLVHQGARAFELWTGQPAPVSLMLAAARAARH